MRFFHLRSHMPGILDSMLSLGYFSVALICKSYTYIYAEVCHFLCLLI